MYKTIPNQLDYSPMTYATFYGPAIVQRRGSFSYNVTRDGVLIGDVLVNPQGRLYKARAADGASWQRDTLHECAEALSLHATERGQ